MHRLICPLGVKFWTLNFDPTKNFRAPSQCNEDLYPLRFWECPEFRNIGLSPGRDTSFNFSSIYRLFSSHMNMEYFVMNYDDSFLMAYCRGFYLNSNWYSLL